MMKKTNLLLSIFFVALTVFASSCEKKSDPEEGPAVEAAKALDGTWKSTQVVYITGEGTPDVNVSGGLVLSVDSGKATGAVVESEGNTIKSVDGVSLFKGISTFSVQVVAGISVITFNGSEVGSASPSSYSKVGGKEILIFGITGLKDYKVSPAATARINSITTATVTFEKQ